METKLSNSEENKRKKGGYDATRVVLTAAGASLAGGAAGAVGTAAYIDSQTPTHVVIDEEGDDEQDTGRQHAENTVEENETHQTPPRNDNEANPTTDEQQAEAQQQTPTDGGNQTPPVSDNIDQVNPDLVAQQVIEEVDPNDVDRENIVQVDAVETMYDVEGNEMQVASVHTPDGGQFLMIDVDNDMVFDVITDLEGNPITQVDGGIAMSDIEDMMDDTGGYLAPTEADDMELAMGEQVTAVDVINTDPDELDIAQLTDNGSTDDVDGMPQDIDMPVDSELPDYYDPTADLNDIDMMG